MGLTERRIDATFSLEEGSFANGSNTLSVSGLRVEALIDDINGVSMGTLQMRIYGMRIEDMNKLSLLGKKYLEARNNFISLSAGDDETGMSEVFSGTIYQGGINYDALPEVAFEIAATAGYYQNVKSAADVSIEGDVSVATLIESIAKGIGFGFTNNGVTAVLSNPYLTGSSLAQITAAAEAARIACNISRGVVSIWPNGGTRDKEVVQVSPETGLVGYPRYSQTGIDVRTMFNPQLINGRKVTVKSDAIGASGDWYCQVVRHELSSQSVNGPWFTTAEMTQEALYVGY